LAPASLRPAMKRHLASGFAVAAAAAVLVLIAVPQLRGAGTAADAPAIASGNPAAVVNANGAASPNGAAAGDPAGALALAAIRPARDPRLDPYFQAHRDFMGAGVMPAAAVYLRSGNEGER
jgi:hypothetical protein